MNNLKCFLLTAFIGLASITSVDNAFAQNQIHTVTKGETLYGIARKYKVNINDLKKWNDLNSNNLIVGQKLLITDPDANYITYLVKPGDTLFGVSKKFDVSIAAIKEWNNLSSNSLRVNQQLKIVTNNKKQNFTDPNVDESARDTASSLISKSVSDNQYYTVKSGDTLYDIARTFNMTVNELKALNDLNTDVLQVGQLLTVKSLSSTANLGAKNSNISVGDYEIYRIKRRETLPDLLNKFNMDSTEFAALNPTIHFDDIRNGLQITVLKNTDQSFQNPYRISSDLQNLGLTPISIYSENEIGKPVTAGGLYNPDKLTAAHPSIELGKVVYVQNPDNNRGIYVIINDRLTEEGIKLSHKAAAFLEGSSQNRTAVKIYQHQ